MSVIERRATPGVPELKSSGGGAEQPTDILRHSPGGLPVEAAASHPAPEPQLSASAGSSVLTQAVLGTPVASPPMAHRAVAAVGFDVGMLSRSLSQDRLTPKLSFQPYLPCGLGGAGMAAGSTPAAPPFLDRSQRAVAATAATAAPPTVVAAAPVAGQGLLRGPAACGPVPRAASPVAVGRSVGGESMPTVVGHHSPVLMHRQVCRSYSGPALRPSDQAQGSPVCAIATHVPSAGSGGSMSLLPKQQPLSQQQQQQAPLPLAQPQPQQPLQQSQCAAPAARSRPPSRENTGPKPVSPQPRFRIVEPISRTPLMGGAPAATTASGTPPRSFPGGRP